MKNRRRICAPIKNLGLRGALYENMVDAEARWWLIYKLSIKRPVHIGGRFLYPLSVLADSLEVKAKKWSKINAHVDGIGSI